MSRPFALLLAPALALTAACTAGAADEGGSAAPQRQEPAQAQLAEPTGVALVPGTGGAELAAATSAALYEAAPLVVVAPADDLAAQARAASAAVSLGVPLLLSPAAADPAAAGGQPGHDGDADDARDPDGGQADGGDATGPTEQEIERLGAQTVLAVGNAATTWSQELDEVDVVRAPEGTAELAGLIDGRLGEAQAVAAPGVGAAVAELPHDGPVPVLELTGNAAAAGDGPTPDADSEPGGNRHAEIADADARDPAAAEDEALTELPELAAPQRLDGVVVLSAAATPDAVAAVATARAAGADVLVLDQPDPRASSAVVETLAQQSSAPVLALGEAFGPADRLTHQVAVARTGVELPGGGQLILPGKLYVALYGHPGSDALGVLGEQGVEATVARAKELAEDYREAGSEVPVVPTFEIITSVASAALGDGDYSDESSLEHLRPLVEAAGREGIYVVLDLQPGYDDFLTQAKMYEELLALPHVGLALDPEWRLKPGERHMRQIGRVGADEVNEVVTWLADLTRERKLPQKLLLLHQFKTFMLEDREQIDMSRPELSIVTQMDGHGSPGTKLETWNIIRPGAPEGMRFGWKNFYDEDRPTLTPKQTLAVDPTPVFVSYQ